MGRRARLRSKLSDEDLEELEELEERLEKTEPGPAAEEKAAQEKAVEANGADGPAARVLELQKSAGNRATAAALSRWPLLGAPQPVAQWPKQLEMVIDGTTVIPLESAQMGVDRRLTNPTGTGAEKEKPVDEGGEMVITLKSGKWSTDLFRESLRGHGYKTVEIVFPAKDGKGFRIILTDVLISNYWVSGRGDGPVDSIALSFKKRELSQDPPPAR